MKSFLCFMLLIITASLQAVEISEIVFPQAFSCRINSTQSFYCQDKIIIVMQYSSENQNSLAFNIYDKQNNPIQEEPILVTDNTIPDYHEFQFDQHTVAQGTPQIFINAENEINFIWTSQIDSTYTISWQKYDLMGKKIWENARILANNIDNLGKFSIQFFDDGSYLTLVAQKELPGYIHHFNTLSNSAQMMISSRPTRYEHVETTRCFVFIADLHAKNDDLLWTNQITAHVSGVANIKALKKNDDILLFYNPEVDEFKITQFSKIGKIRKTTFINRAFTIDKPYSVLTLGNNLVLNYLTSSDPWGPTIAVLDSSLNTIKSITFDHANLPSDDPASYINAQITPLDNDHFTLSIMKRFPSENYQNKNYSFALSHSILDKNLTFTANKDLLVKDINTYSTYKILKLADGNLAYKYSMEKGFNLIDQNGKLLFSSKDTLPPTTPLEKITLLSLPKNKLLIVGYSEVNKQLEFNFVKNAKTLSKDNILIIKTNPPTIIHQEICEFTAGFCYLWSEKIGNQIVLNYTFIDKSFHQTTTRTLTSMLYTTDNHQPNDSKGLSVISNTDGTVTVLFTQKHNKEVHQFNFSQQGTLLNPKPIILNLAENMDNWSTFTMNFPQGFNLYYLTPQKEFVYYRFRNNILIDKKALTITVPDNYEIQRVSPGLVNLSIKNSKNSRFNCPLDSVGINFDLKIPYLQKNRNITPFQDGYLYESITSKEYSFNFYSSVTKQSNQIAVYPVAEYLNDPLSINQSLRSPRLSGIEYLVKDDAIYVASPNLDSNFQTLTKYIFVDNKLSQDWTIQNSIPYFPAGIYFINNQIILFGSNDNKNELWGFNCNGEKTLASVDVKTTIYNNPNHSSNSYIRNLTNYLAFFQRYNNSRKIVFVKL